MCIDCCSPCCLKCWNLGGPKLTNKDEVDGPSDSNPLKKRGCTDVWCLFVFIAMWLGMIFIGVMSYSMGNVDRLIYGYDSYGNICGHNNSATQSPAIKEVSVFSGMDMTHREFVFFLDIRAVSQSVALCVSACPNTTLGSMEQVRQFALDTGSRLCTYDIAPDQYLLLEEGEGEAPPGLCPVLPVPHSTPVLQRCVPTSIQDVGSLFINNIYGFLNASEILRRVISDLYASWRYVLGFCVLALVLSILVCIMMYLIAAFLVWLVLTLASLASIVLTAFLWWQYASIKRTLDAKSDAEILDRESDNEYAFLIYAVIATAFTVILLLVIGVLCKRIKFVIQLFEQAGETVGDMVTIFLQPFWTAAIMIVFLAFWSSIMFYLASSSIAVRDPTSHNMTSYEDVRGLHYMWWYMLVCLIWNVEFIIACQQMTVAGAVAAHYFTPKDADSGKRSVVCPIGGSICRLMKHHLGSVALGSAIITIIKLPRIIMLYVTRRIKEYKEAKECLICVEVCEKACCCCLKCVERCVKYLNQNAYTITAIDGSNFCGGAKKAFSVLVNNALRVIAINSVGDFVLFTSKVMIVALTGVIALPVFQSVESLHYYAIPLFLVCLFSYFIADCFISVYEVVIDTLFLCYCLAEAQYERDMEANERLMKDNKRFKEAVRAADAQFTTMSTQQRQRVNYDGEGGECCGCALSMCCRRRPPASHTRRPQEEEGQELQTITRTPDTR